MPSIGLSQMKSSSQERRGEEGLLFIAFPYYNQKKGKEGERKRRGLSSGFLPTVRGREREHSTCIASASAFAYVSPAVQSEATHSGGGDGQEVQFPSPPYILLRVVTFLCVCVPSFLYSCAAVAYRPILFVDSRRDTQKSIHSTLHTAE